MRMIDADKLNEKIIMPEYAEQNNLYNIGYHNALEYVKFLIEIYTFDVELECEKNLNEVVIDELRKENYELEEKNKELKSFIEMLLSDIQKYGAEVTGIEFTSYRGINLEELLKGGVTGNEI